MIFKKFLYPIFWFLLLPLVSYGAVVNVIIDGTTVGRDSTLVFDNTSKYLGIGTTTPFTNLSVAGGIFANDRVSGSFLKATSTAVNLASITVTNTAASTTVFTGDTWRNRTIPANSLRAGDQLCIDLRGLYTAPLAASVTARLVMGTGAATTTIAQLTTSSLANTTNQQFDGNGCATVRSVGSSGTVQGNGQVIYSTGVAGTVATDYMRGSGTVNTTVSQTIDVTVQWDTNNVNRSVTFEQASSWLK